MGVVAGQKFGLGPRKSERNKVRVKRAEVFMRPGSNPALQSPIRGRRVANRRGMDKLELNLGCPGRLAALDRASRAKTSRLGGPRRPREAIMLGLMQIRPL